LKSAEQGNADADYYLGLMYQNGNGVKKDYIKAHNWYLKSAQKGRAYAQHNLAYLYANGLGVSKDSAVAAKWFTRAANQDNKSSQIAIAIMYAGGIGVTKNEIEAYKWLLIAGRNEEKIIVKAVPHLERNLNSSQRAEGQRLAKEWIQQQTIKNSDGIESNIDGDSVKATGTGFFISNNGYILTCYHVIEDASEIQIKCEKGMFKAEVVRTDEDLDIALLKVSGAFQALPIISSREIRLGHNVTTLGFPNVNLQGSEPKLSRGEISGLSGVQDNAKHFQISVPVQPGNSGGGISR
jgi:S1-C subfamily serine protease